MVRLALAALSALLIALTLTPLASAAPVPEGAAWSEATIDTTDGVKLHADILRPKHLAEDAKTPVIVSVGPYFGHAGQLGAVGAAQGEDYDPTGPSEGPSSRFYDFIVGAELMKRGYTFVMVDLRGFGGSTGCLDWAGPGEQADVRAAVEFAAKDLPWSSGKVGMYGKSYDGVTGLIGTALKPDGLAAVVAQEPVYDLYRYLYSNGVRYVNSLLTPALYDGIAATPGPIFDSEYVGGSIDDSARPGCPALNWADQQEEDHDAPYWKDRDLIAKAKGSDVPLFLTQGFLENNTKPDGAFEFFANAAGPKRAWFGMWDHVRGNERDADKRLKMGREGFFDEVMRFYDEHLRGVEPQVQDPPVVVQTSDGTWRAEQAWPPADARALTSALKPGSYQDTGDNNGTADGGSPNGEGIWTFSPPLPHDAHLAGVPRAALDVVTQGPRANLVVNVHDVAPDGIATLISRGTTRVDKSGKVDLELLGNDWRLPAGHRVGVLVTSSNAEWWMHVPTLQTVEVESAEVQLPWLAQARTQTIQGDSAVKLDDYRESAPFKVDQATIDEGTSPSFALPPAMTHPTADGAPTAPAPATAEAQASAASVATTANPVAKRRLSAKLVRRGSRWIVTGRAPSGTRLVVRLRRGSKVVLTRSVTARRGAYRATFVARRPGRYSALVRTARSTWRASARTRTLSRRR